MQLGMLVQVKEGKAICEIAGGGAGAGAVLECCLRRWSGRAGDSARAHLCMFGAGVLGCVQFDVLAQVVFWDVGCGLRCWGRRGRIFATLTAGCCLGRCSGFSLSGVDASFGFCLCEGGSFCFLFGFKYEKQREVGCSPVFGNTQVDCRDLPGLFWPMSASDWHLWFLPRVNKRGGELSCQSELQTGSFLEAPPKRIPRTEAKRNKNRQTQLCAEVRPYIYIYIPCVCI